MRAMPSPPIQVFRPGRHVDASGQALEFSAADLRATAAAYDPAVHEAPLVVGHPTQNGPAYGWDAALAFAEPTATLDATPAQVEPQFAELVRAGRFKRVSASFYTPDSPANPKPGAYYLRHVGFLGAQPPAVKGLRPAEFGEDEAGVITVDFSQEPAMPETDRTAEFAERERQLTEQATALEARQAEIAAREQRLAEQEQARHRADCLSFAEGLIKEGRVLPRERQGLVALLAGLSGEPHADFAEEGAADKPQTSADWLRGFLSRLPVQVDFSERTGAGAGDVNAKPADAEIARKARTYRDEQAKAGIAVSFAEAVDVVRKQLNQL